MKTLGIASEPSFNGYRQPCQKFVSQTILETFGYDEL